MRLMIEKALILKSVELFSGVPEGELAPVAAIMDEVGATAGEDIIVEGEFGTSMYIIVEGHVCVHRGGREVAILGPRDVFGEFSALDPAPRSATVTAQDSVELLKLSAAPLLELLTENPAVIQGVFKVLCRRVRSGLDN